LTATEVSQFTGLRAKLYNQGVQAMHSQGRLGQYKDSDKALWLHSVKGIAKKLPKTPLPVQTTPSVEAGSQPQADDTPPLPERPGTEKDPVREAEQSALKARLQEMERAEELAQEHVQQQPRFAAEPQKRQTPENPCACPELD